MTHRLAGLGRNRIASRLVTNLLFDFEQADCLPQASVCPSVKWLPTPFSLSLFLLQGKHSHWSPAPSPMYGLSYKVVTMSVEAGRAGFEFHSQLCDLGLHFSEPHCIVQNYNSFVSSPVLKFRGCCECMSTWSVQRAQPLCIPLRVQWPVIYDISCFSKRNQTSSCFYLMSKWLWTATLMKSRNGKTLLAFLLATQHVGS